MRKQMRLQILLADDHAVFRQSLKALLEREGFAVVGEASDGRQALKLARNLRPDIAVLDLRMPVLSGLETARKMPRACSTTKTIILTVHSEIQYIWEALRDGIWGYVVKRRASEELGRAIRETAQGRFYLCPVAADVLVRALLAKTQASGKSLL